MSVGSREYVLSSPLDWLKSFLESEESDLLVVKIRGIILF